MNENCNVIVLSNRAIEEIRNESFSKPNTETGGILLGKVIEDKWYVIATTKPGPNSILEHAYFEYDTEYVNKKANEIAKEYKFELELLGLWHRHPGSLDTFSATDNGTNQKFAELNPKGAISGLVNLDPDFRLTFYHVSIPLEYNKIEVFQGDEYIPDKLLEKIINNENSHFSEELDHTEEDSIKEETPNNDNKPNFFSSNSFKKKIIPILCGAYMVSSTIMIGYFVLKKKDPEVIQKSEVELNPTKTLESGIGTQKDQEIIIDDSLSQAVIDSVKNARAKATTEVQVETTEENNDKASDTALVKADKSLPDSETKVSDNSNTATKKKTTPVSGTTLEKKGENIQENNDKTPNNIKTEKRDETPLANDAKVNITKSVTKAKEEIASVTNPLPEKKPESEQDEDNTSIDNKESLEKSIPSSKDSTDSQNNINKVLVPPSKSLPEKQDKVTDTTNLEN